MDKNTAHAQGLQFGRKMAREFHVRLVAIVEAARRAGGTVWFLGRDCDGLPQALNKLGLSVRYLFGLNRGHANASGLSRWLRDIGLKSGDVLVDTGFGGSIPRAVIWAGFWVRGVLLTGDGLREVDRLPEVDHNDPDDSARVVCLSSRRPELREFVVAFEHAPKRGVVSKDFPPHRVGKSSLYDGESSDRTAVLDDGGKVGRAFVRGFVTGYVREVRGS